MARLLIDEAATAALLRERLNAEMLEAAEPILQRALAEIERDMRRRLGAFIIGTLEQHVDVYRHQDRLVITLNPNKDT